jgi:hypothetical protein
MYIMAKGASRGFGGLPVGLGFGVGSVVQCKADDTSWFCQLTKLVSTIGMIMFLLFIVWIIYFFLFAKKGRK